MNYDIFYILKSFENLRVYNLIEFIIDLNYNFINELLYILNFKIFLLFLFFYC